MSSSENSSLSSDSSSVDSNTTAVNQWEERVSQQNHQIYTTVENLLSNIPNLTAGVQASRVRKRHCERQHEIGVERLINDYFGPNPTYGPEVFRRRFRMHKSVFLRIVEAVTANDEYFQERRDAAGRQSLSSLQKCTGAMRVLAYGTSSDVVDEYLRMSSTATRDSLMHFVDGVISCFGATYLRRPTKQDMAKLIYVADQRGFPGMIRSIYCMHWQWKNCPNAWAGQYTGRSGKPTIILEAVASYDLWIWHASFGTPGGAFGCHYCWAVKWAYYSRPRIRAKRGPKLVFFPL
ncbi:uncharacterized protein LOC121771368 [Salvia splendens]|uniref:uncharacterized protein LOC121771368 n=1 Tax=Salvia splendens TaxID=180675 RepID=UPI001C258A3F|nr:uncharacterized protein LOC121771368 [Salvia splendens]